MLSEKQISYWHDSTQSFNIAEGAVSSGKTYAQILRWIEHCYSVPVGSLLMMSGKTNESLYDNVIRDKERLLGGDCKVYRNPLRVKIRSRNIEIACVDANNERSWGKVQGKTVYGWLADEVVQYPLSFVNMAIGRCRGDGKVWPKFWTCNPDHPQHYIKTNFIDNDKLDRRSWHFNLDDNPILSEQYKDELKNAYTGVFYDRYILGKWVLAEGSVYPDFSRETHVYKDMQLPDAWYKVRGIDFGYTNPFVCLWGAVDQDGRLYIYDEHYQAKALIKDHAEAISRRGDKYYFTVADHDAQDIAELRAQGIDSTNAIKAVIAGIQKVAARLKVQPDGYPRLMISDKCVNTIREFESYRWAEVKEGRNEKEEPIKDEDHCMDTTKYICAELDKGQSGPSAVTAASLGM